MKDDFKTFGATDVAVAVVLGIIARAFMLIASPLANVYLRGLGPAGDTINALLAYPILFGLVALAGAIRSNGLTALVCAWVMAIVRSFTGDPFGIFALEAFTVGGIMAWFGMAALRYKQTTVNWLLWSFLWATGIQIAFIFIWGVYPIYGSMQLGWAKLLTLDDIITAVVMCAIVVGLSRKLSAVQGLKSVYKKV